MKTSQVFRVLLAAALAAGVAGAASAQTAGGALKAAAEIAGVKIPDFKTASVADLSAAATQALDGLKGLASSSPAVLEKAKAVQAALSAGNASGAVGALTGLAEAAKKVPGASQLTEASKQLVSAWALKQGFDASKISGVLGALQKQDLSALASKGATLLAGGGLTGDQQGLLKGVLGAYGIDTSKTAGAAGALKGFFGN